MIVSVIALAAVATGGWTSYSNPRFAFSICYPADTFRPGRPPDNGDGQAFAAGDGAELAVWGSNDALDHGLRGERTTAERGRKGITYRATGANWFVLSGKADGRIFYRKTFFAEERFVTFELTYPERAAARYRAIATRMQACFRYGKRPF